jgi:ATP-binding cassette, subfamily B, bacterial
VPHKGKVVEQGTHRQPLNASGRYAELYSSQASAYACDDPDTDFAVNNG